MKHYAIANPEMDIMAPSTVSNYLTDGPVSHALPSRSRARLVVVMMFAVVMIASLCIILTRYGSLSVAIRVLKGESLLLTSTRLDAGRISIATSVRIEAEVRNYTGRPVRLLGATSRCTCVVVGELPQLIQPNQKIRFPIQVRALEGKPNVDETIVIFTDDPGRPSLSVHVSSSTRP